MKNRVLRCLAILVGGAVLGSAYANTIHVEVGGTRANSTEIDSRVETAVKQFARQTARLSRSFRDATRRPGDPVFTLPLRVVLTSNGIPLPAKTVSGGRAPGDDIVPTFDASGARAFPTAYKTLLQDTFTAARPAMNSIFGAPAVGGAVSVKNYDADIQDRYAVAGGYYVPNAPGGPEIRFPVYLNDVSASINYIHTLLMAYMGPNVYFADAFNEGLARAATMAVARTPSSLPNAPSSGQIEATLDSLYDVTQFYDWYNQPALGGPQFIAPNLLNTVLPVGGSTGGIFLLRYQMSGSAWAKVQAEYPGFIAEFNRRYYIAPVAYPDEDSLIGLGQTVIDFLRGSAGATVEGQSFAVWYRRQHILNTRLTAGMKVLQQPVPVSPTAGSSDFGVFGLVINAFRTDSQGSETLLAGKTYPVFLRPDGGRFFTSAQEDVVDISGGYGSAVPNFPASTFSNAKYRVSSDIPFEGQVSRVYLPAGGFANGSSPTPNNFYGTLTGLPVLSSSASYVVRVDWLGGSVTSIAVTNFAFGTRITDASYDKAQQLTVRVFRVEGASSTEVINRVVNKGQGAVALDLRTSAAYANTTINWPAALRMVGLPGQATRPNFADILGLSSADTLAANYNSTKNAYDLYPEFGGPTTGQGFFVRPPSAVSKTVETFNSPATAVVVHLRPGWNLITNPFPDNLATTSVTVGTAAESLATFEAAKGDLIGVTMFGFTPDGSNPDGGTLTEATSFPAGQGIFIRALRPEGAILIFTPGGAPLSNAVKTRTASLAAPAGNPTWQAKATIQSQSGLSSQAWFGNAAQATANVDARFDSEVPGHPGGYQLWVEGPNKRPMYREYRPDAQKQKFTIRLSGLKPGQSYRFALEQQGNRLIDMTDPLTFYTRSGTQALTYQFVARKTEHIIEVTVTNTVYGPTPGFGAWPW